MASLASVTFSNENWLFHLFSKSPQVSVLLDRMACGSQEPDVWKNRGWWTLPGKRLGLRVIHDNKATLQAGHFPILQALDTLSAIWLFYNIMEQWKLIFLADYFWAVDAGYALSCAECCKWLTAVWRWTLWTTGSCFGCGRRARFLTAIFTQRRAASSASWGSFWGGGLLGAPTLGLGLKAWGTVNGGHRKADVDGRLAGRL